MSALFSAAEPTPAAKSSFAEGICLGLALMFCKNFSFHDTVSEPASSSNAKQPWMKHDGSLLSHPSSPLQPLTFLQTLHLL